MGIGRVDLIEEQIICPACDWEFCIDSNAEIVDEGEVATDWELEVDEEGELNDAREALLPSPYEIKEHDLAQRGWVDDDYEMESHSRVNSALCPSCGQAFKGAWPGHVRCLACDWVFRIDYDPTTELQDDYDDDSEPEFPSTAPESIRTLTVSSDGKFSFNRIGDALRNAQAGDRICVKPGLYEEEITIFFQLEIIGDGPVNEIILVGRNGPCVTVEYASAVVRGMTLRGLAGMYGQSTPTVDLKSGVLEDCAITSDSLACVKIHEQGVLRRCLVHDGEDVGILGGTGLVAECTIVRNASAGIAIQKDSDLIIRDSFIGENSLAGIVFSEGSTGIVANCTIADNGAGGIVLKGDRSLIWKCRILGNNANGILADCEAVGAVEESEIASNRGDGVSIRAAHLHLDGCRIEQHRDNGISVSGSGVVQIEDCTIIANGENGLAIEDGANPHVSYCNINGNEKYAVSIRNASAIVEDCDLTANGRGTVEHAQFGEVIYQRNRE